MKLDVSVKAAPLIDELLADLESIEKESDGELNVADAARISGYTADHLSRLVREGKLTNYGRKGAPRVRRSDLPMRARSEKWIKLEMALVVAEATGRRLGSIRQLAWSDIDFGSDTILWRADTDKKGKAWRIPMTETLRDELKAFRVRLGGAFGGLLFPSQKDASKPIRTDVISKWLQAVEAKVELAPLDGSLWHAYRRSWASSRKRQLPAADVAAGGWSDLTTLLRC